LLTDLLEAAKPEYENPEGIQPQDYLMLDMRTSRLCLIRDYVSFSEAINVNQEHTAQEECFESFLKNLRMQSFDGFENASFILNEMKENISPKRIRETLQADSPAISIHLDTVEVNANQSSQLTARFHEEALNKAVARNEIRCIWHFAHNSLVTHDDLRTKGWTVWHYFPKPEKYQITASFLDKQTYR
jgi:hypothetical protein